MIWHLDSLNVLTRLNIFPRFYAINTTIPLPKNDTLTGSHGALLNITGKKETDTTGIFSVIYTVQVSILHVPVPVCGNYTHFFLLSQEFFMPGRIFFDFAGFL
jgi:hypothetical protein